MSAVAFDIIAYMSGLTGYLVDKDALQRIAIDRGVSYVTMYSELTAETKDLLRADILYVVYTSPTTTASSSKSHDSYTNANGAQTISSADKDRIFAIIKSIYSKYGDEKLELLDDSETGLSWIEL